MHFDWPNGRKTDVQELTITTSDGKEVSVYSFADHDTENRVVDSDEVDEVAALALAKAHISFGFDLIQFITGRTIDTHLRGMPGQGAPK